MLKELKNAVFVKKLRKTNIYTRLRQYLPMPSPYFLDDREHISDAEVVSIEWPTDVQKPCIGIVQDYGDYPRWTKYCRFLENNGFPYSLYDIHVNDWIEKAFNLDVIIGIPSCEFFHLEELRKKYFVLEYYLGKICYPSLRHLTLYEDKSLETYISKAAGFPFANTYVSNDKIDALRIIETLKYPVVCKNESSSGSVGVELIHNIQHARRIVEKAFSINGRGTHLLYKRQKNYVYFQDFIPNDGYDIRAIVVGNWGFGYYRKVLRGDFRASGMNQVERRGLPEEPIRIAWEANKVIKSPVLVVDMLHGNDDNYYVIEISPICEVNTPVQLQVGDEPGVYILEDDGSIHFEVGRYWLHELALRQFLLNDYLPKHLNGGMQVRGQEPQ
jgi:glutathione synthase/RimK-type ligase-like ATP-grasp enzyme